MLKLNQFPAGLNGQDPVEEDSHDIAQGFVHRKRFVSKDVGSHDAIDGAGIGEEHQPDICIGADRPFAFPLLEERRQVGIERIAAEVFDIGPEPGECTLEVLLEIFADAADLDAEHRHDLMQLFDEPLVACDDGFDFLFDFSSHALDDLADEFFFAMEAFVERFLADADFSDEVFDGGMGETAFKEI